MTKQDTNKSLTKKGLVGAFWQASSTLIRILTQFIMLGVLARLISQTDFGYIAFIMILVGFTDLFSKMGIGGALIQMENITKSHIKTGYTLSLVFGTFIGLFFYFLTPFIASFFQMEAITDGLHFYAFLFPIRSLNSVSYSLLSKDLKYALVEKINLSAFVFGYALVAIILAFLDFGYWALLYGQLAMIIIQTIFYWYHHFPNFSFNWKKIEVNQLLSFGSGYTINTILGYFSDTIDNLLISKFIGARALGIYSKAYQLYVLPSGILGGVYNQVMFPILSKRKNDLNKLTDFYFFSISLNILLLTPIAIIALINSELIILTILGPGWEEAILILQILILSLPARFGYRINRSFFDAQGLVYKSTIFEIVFFISVLILCILGFYLWELPGVALGVLLASNVFFYSALIYLSKLLKVPYFLNKKLILSTFLYNFPILILSILVLYYFDPSYWVLLSISLSLLIPLFIIVLFFNKKSVIFTPSNVILINQIIKNLPIKIQLKLKKVKARFKTK